MLMRGGVKMNRAEIFLECYRQLEEELVRKYQYEEKSGSPVMRFLSDKESRLYREKLNYCREIRNFLSHHSEWNGEPLIEPSEELTEFLRAVTDYLRQPPLALSFATQFENILKASPKNKAVTVMKKMQKLGFSHVPVLDSGKLIGIFSIGTFFSFALKNDLAAMNDEMLIESFSEFLNPDRHENERFLFLPPTATLFEVKNEFEKRSQRSKRLAVIFITDNGSIGGRIMGMLTPWDVVNEL